MEALLIRLHVEQSHFADVSVFNLVEVADLGLAALLAIALMAVKGSLNRCQSLTPFCLTVGMYSFSPEKKIYTKTDAKNKLNEK